MKAKIFKMKYSKGLIGTRFLVSGFGAFQSLIYKINSLQTQLTFIDSTVSLDLLGPTILKIKVFSVQGDLKAKGP